MSNVSAQSGWWQWYRELRFLDFGILLTCLSLSPISKDNQQDSTLWRGNDAKQQHAATTDQVHNNNRKQARRKTETVPLEVGLISLTIKINNNNKNYT